MDTKLLETILSYKVLCTWTQLYKSFTEHHDETVRIDEPSSSPELLIIQETGRGGLVHAVTWFNTYQSTQTLINRQAFFWYEPVYQTALFPRGQLGTDTSGLKEGGALRHLGLSGWMDLHFWTPTAPSSGSIQLRHTPCSGAGTFRWLLQIYFFCVCLVAFHRWLSSLEGHRHERWENGVCIWCWIVMRGMLSQERLLVELGQEGARGKERKEKRLWECGRWIYLPPPASYSS